MKRTIEIAFAAMTLAMVACEKEEDEPTAINDPVEIMAAAGQRGCYTWSIQETDGFESEYMHNEGRLIFFEKFRERYLSDNTIVKEESKYQMEYRWIAEHTITADSVVFNSDSTYATANIECRKTGVEKAIMTGSAVFEEFNKERTFYPTQATFVLDNGDENTVTIKATMSMPETFTKVEIY